MNIQKSITYHGLIRVIESSISCLISSTEDIHNENCNKYKKQVRLTI